jgi:hypothetical protein
MGGSGTIGFHAGKKRHSIHYEVVKVRGHMDGGFFDERLASCIVFLIAGNRFDGEIAAPQGVQIYPDAPLHVGQLDSIACFLYLQFSRGFLGFPAKGILQFACKAAEGRLHSGNTARRECRPEQAYMKIRIFP